jgi:hypothetical protein
MRGDNKTFTNFAGQLLQNEKTAHSLDRLSVTILNNVHPSSKLPSSPRTPYLSMSSTLARGTRTSSPLSSFTLQILTMASVGNF